jgi:hypothetical protein
MITYTIIVLSDGETYSDISGCEIITLTKEGIEALESGNATIRDLKMDSRNLIVSTIQMSNS